tara:strand:+ start:112 stop:294 length:183 start_codon:yes stop_codon:yes gene_type:complete
MFTPMALSIGGLLKRDRNTEHGSTTATLATRAMLSNGMCRLAREEFKSKVNIENLVAMHA